MRTKKRLLVFCDPGFDDSLALTWLLAHTHAVEIVGVVPVAGRVPAAQASRVVRNILHDLGHGHIPIYSTEHIEQKHNPTPGVAGWDDLGGPVPFDVGGDSVSPLSPELFGEEIPVDTGLLSLSPCTVPGQFISTAGYAPSCGVFMGGSLDGHKEFNFGLDQDAARQVLKGFGQPRVVPRETGRLLEWHTDAKDGEPASCGFYNDYFRALVRRYKRIAANNGRQYIYPHALVAAVACLYPKAFVWEGYSLQDLWGTIRFEPDGDVQVAVGAAVSVEELNLLATTLFV